jgi:precorrin-6Y C5,15-methyltransferase (decarboxylating)
VVGLARRFRKLGVLTDPRNTPARIAGALLAAGVANCRAVVVERLGEPAEAVIDTDLADLASRSCAPLNVLLLVQGPGWRPAPAASSRPDDAYAHRDGLITKRDIRVLALARLALRETDVAWDVGAGSGAMSIEMGEQAWRGRVVAVERDARCLELIRTNVERFGALNVDVVAGDAPAALDGQPAPDAVFIGGSGGNLEAILVRVAERAAPGCRLVATFALLENLVAAHAWLAGAGWAPSITQAQLATGEGIGAGTRLVPANPVFIVRAVRPEGGA